jgi:hypothetical protein
MSKRSKIPEVRRHIRDKSTIDHLTSGPSKPNMAPTGQKNRRQFNERNRGKQDLRFVADFSKTADRGGCRTSYSLSREISR